MFEEEFFRDVDIKSQTSLECENFSEKALNALSGILRDENCKIERLYLCGVFDYTLVYSSDLYKSLTSASCTVRKLMIESSDNHGVVNALLMMVAASHNGFDSIFSTENDTLEITHDNVHLVHRAALKIRDLIIDVEEENVRKLCSQLKNTGIQALTINFHQEVISQDNLAAITELIMNPNSITKFRLKNKINNPDFLEAALLSPFCRVENLDIRSDDDETSEEGFIRMFTNVFSSPVNRIRQLTYMKHSYDWTAFIDTLTLPQCKVQILSIGAIINGRLFTFDDFFAEYLCEKIKSLEIKSVRKIKTSRHRKKFNKALLEASRSRMMLTLLEGNLIQRTNTASLLRTLPTDVVRSMKKYF